MANSVDLNETAHYGSALFSKVHVLVCRDERVYINCSVFLHPSISGRYGNQAYSLTFTILLANSADDKLVIFFLVFFFSENRI